MFKWLKELFSPSVSSSRPTAPQDYTRLRPQDPMDQGDYHSGPYGYSPNTAYPETQYGSNFDEDADWNEGDER
jgi:hypothetical protein